MPFAFLPFPYLNSYSLTTQFLILLVIGTLAYFYRHFRSAVLAFIAIYTTYRIAVPLIRWGYVAFKAIAWFGFYVHFFFLGIGYIFTAAVAIWNSPDLLQTLIDSLEGK
ncbi:hypothetical protein B0H11DRAFT_313250 [Mycena galericulata]|nr:hypothetical protein B0H11DRAFT_313250 [Mycena galericulata]